MNDDILMNLILNRTLFLYQEIDAEIATKFAATLFWLNQENSQKEIIVYINSLGGNIDDGLFAIYDAMQAVSAPISTICLGTAYSSGAVILAAGTIGKRKSFPNAKIMIHSLQIEEISGSQSEIEKETKLNKKFNQTMMEILAKHSGKKISKIKRDCKQNRFFSPEEALQYGLIDEIIQPIKEIPLLLK